MNYSLSGVSRCLAVGREVNVGSCSKIHKPISGYLIGICKQEHGTWRAIAFKKRTIFVRSDLRHIWQSCKIIIIGEVWSIHRMLILDWLILSVYVCLERYNNLKIDKYMSIYKYISVISVKVGNTRILSISKSFSYFNNPYSFLYRSFDE